MLAVSTIGLVLGTYGGLLPPRSTLATRPYFREVRIDKLSAFVLSFDVANNSDLAAAALSDGRVRVWKLQSDEKIHEFYFPAPATDEKLKVKGQVEPISVHFSPDGKYLAISFISRIHLFDVAAWDEQISLGVPGEDEHRPDLVITTKTSQLQKRSTAEAEAAKNKPIQSLNDSTTSWAKAMETGDGRTRIADFAFTTNGSSIIAAYCRGGCYASPSFRWAAFPTGNDPVRLWDVRTAHLMWERVYEDKSVVDRIVPSPSQSRFAAVYSRPGTCAVGMNNLDDGSRLWIHSFGPCADPPPVEFYQDGRSFITNRIDEGDHKNKLWSKAATYRTDSGKMISDFSNHDTIRYADMNSDGRWLVTATWRGLRFQLWDASLQKPVAMESPKEWKWRGPLINLVRFSPDGRWLVIGNRELGDLVIYQFGDSWTKN